MNDGGETIRRVAVLLNSGGGAIARAGCEAMRQQVVEACARAGLDAVVMLVAGDEIAQAASEAATQWDAVVVGGGDGTISAAAGALVDGKVPLGLLPLGTLNHFTRDLGIPADLDGALAIIAAGHVRRVDAAEVNGRVFVNNSSVGVYPAMVRDRERQQQALGRSKRVAMLLASFRALRHFRHRRLTVRAEGRSSPCVTPLVFVGNNDYSLAFPGIGERARLDGGELCVYVVHGSGTRGLLRLAAKSLIGRVDADRDFDRLTGLASAEIDARDARLSVAVDGEVVTMDTPLRYRTRPQALRVLAPAP